MSSGDPRHAPLGGARPRVEDTQIGRGIVARGQVYGMEIRGDVAHITHTLTTPGCPMERIIRDGIREAAGLVEGIRGVETRLVWEPAWHPGMITDGAWAQ